MPREFRRYEPDQGLLLPPSLRDWLPEGHLAFFVSDAIDALDRCGFEARQAEAVRGAGAESAGELHGSQQPDHEARQLGLRAMLQRADRRGRDGADHRRGGRGPRVPRPALHDLDEPDPRRRVARPRRRSPIEVFTIAEMRTARDPSSLGSPGPRAGTAEARGPRGPRPPRAPAARARSPSPQVPADPAERCIARRLPRHRGQT